MKRTLLCTSFILVLTASLVADSNLRIDDVGLHGYYGIPAAVRLTVRNPSSQAQPIHLQVAVANQYGVTNTVAADMSLSGGEQRQLELPILAGGGETKFTADVATAGGAVFGHDDYQASPHRAKPIILMCASEDVCKTAQSQIQFSGTIEERADKNRQTAFEVVADPRDHWWAYSAGKAIVLAMPLAKLTLVQRHALEGFLRRGGRLVLLEHEIADASFLSAYRQTPTPPKGERVGKGTLFRVSGLSSNTLGDIFTGRNLLGVLSAPDPWPYWTQMDWLRRRFAAAFNFPRLRWLLIWLMAYIVIIGALNFAVLRSLHRLEWGWITVCVLALLFAVGFYFSSASRRPSGFRLDNLAVYYLDARSPLAAADYSLRISAPERRNVVVSVADPAVFTLSNSTGGESHSQIWVEMNRPRVGVNREYDIHFGPPSQIELSLLKWSFRDLNLQGLHEFPGTVHVIAPNRLRNDTGQHFGEAVYLDYTSNTLYSLPALAPGDEIQLDTLTQRPIRTQDEKRQPWVPPGLDSGKESLQELALRHSLPFVTDGRLFAGFSDGPALPVELNISHQQSAHALIVVVLEQP